jgi:hypothetical protein
MHENVTHGRRTVAVVAAVVAVLGLTGCAELRPTELNDIGDDGISLRPLLDPDSIAIPGTDSDDVIETLGEPTETTSRKPPENQRPGRVKTLRYDGLEVVVRELNKPRRRFISDLVITSDAYATRLPIGIGTPRAEIEEVLGPPSETEGQEAVYKLTDDGDRCIVTYEDGRAIRLTFQFG